MVTFINVRVVPGASLCLLRVWFAVSLVCRTRLARYPDGTFDPAVFIGRIDAADRCLTRAFLRDEHRGR